MAGSFGLDENLNNLKIFLNCLTWEKLRRTYELLFPNEPLPRGTYTESRLREIISGKLSESVVNMLGNNNFSSNLGVVPMDYEEAINDMDDLKYMY
jgi:hypothetical protein